MSDTAISVVVAVYNREDLLDRCIDSLVYQTLENIELVFVDDQSTDHSMEVLRRWQAQFPDKIKIFYNPNKGVANAKNLGILKSCGEYVTFVDSDDYVDYEMLERLYACAVQNEFPEMVHSPIWSISGNRKWSRATMAPDSTIEDCLTMQDFFLVGKIFRRDLFDRFGVLPELRIGEDVSWVFPVISYMDKVGYCGVPGYYYELSPNSISMNTSDPRIVDDLIQGSEWIIRETNPLYREKALIYALRRIRNLSRTRVAYADILNELFLKKSVLLDEIEDLETKAPDLVRAVEAVKEHYCVMPQNVFMNGFGGLCSEQSTEEYKNIFTKAADITILNEQNCDLDRCPGLVAEAYRQGNYEFVGKYFAVKACYEQGGIYIDGDLVIDNPFNMLINDPAFFGFENDAAFTDKVFGCCPGNPCFGRILQTYEMPELYDEPYAPLKDRMKTILVGAGNVQMGSCMLRKPEYGFCLYPVDMFVYTLPCAENAHVCHYKPEVLAMDECVTVPVSILESLVDRRVRTEVGNANKEVRRQKQRYEKEKARSNKRSAYIAKMEKQREYMENSASWKITKPLRMIKKILGG